MERMQARTIAQLMHLVARLELAPPARPTAPPGDMAHDGPT
jgi:hypothetical protein